MGRSYVEDRIDKTIMQSLVVVLEDMVSRLKKNQESDKEPPLDECLRIAEANRLVEELRHLISLPPTISMEAQSEPSDVGHAHQDNSAQPPTPYPSRIISKLNNGQLRTAVPKEGDDEVIQFGMGKIEISENDEVTDVVQKDTGPTTDSGGNVVPLPNQSR